MCIRDSNRFTLEESASLIVEENSTYSVVEYLRSETTNDEKIKLEDFFNPRNTFGIRLEQDSYDEDVIIMDNTESSKIVLDGTDSDGSNAGHNISLALEGDSSATLAQEDISTDNVGVKLELEEFFQSDTSRESRLLLEDHLSD